MSPIFYVSRRAIPAILFARDGHHVLSARKRGIFPSRHKWQRLALGAATRGRGTVTMPNSFIADPNLFQALEQRSIPVPCLTGRILFNQGDVPSGLYFLKTGMVSLIMKTEKGKEVVHLTVRPGSVLGLPAIVGNEPYTLSAMAHHGSEVDFVARKDFEELMQEEPCLFPKVLEILAAEVRSARFVLSRVIGKRRSRASRVSA
jgi:CRP-like cAMP-binding protein